VCLRQGEGGVKEMNAQDNDDVAKSAGYMHDQEDLR
jgi:hypothetical protein